MLEFLLLVFAWRRGWKSLALIPVGLAIVAGFLMGAAGASLDETGLAVLLPDLVATAVLGLMCAVKPQQPRWTATTSPASQQGYDRRPDVSVSDP